jgi:Glycosyltransferase family 43
VYSKYSVLFGGLSVPLLCCSFPTCAFIAMLPVQGAGGNSHSPKGRLFWLLRWTLALLAFITLSSGLYFATQVHNLFSFDVGVAPDRVVSGVVLNTPTATATATAAAAVTATTAAERLVLIITPTFERDNQESELFAIARTLQKVPQPVLWLVIEDPEQHRQKVLGDDDAYHNRTWPLLEKWGVPYLLLRPDVPQTKDIPKSCMPYIHGTCLNRRKHRGVSQRNWAIRVVMEIDIAIPAQVQQNLDLFPDADENRPRVPSLSIKDQYIYRQSGQVLHRGVSNSQLQRMLQQHFDWWKQLHPDQSSLPKRQILRQAVAMFQDDDNVYHPDLIGSIRSLKKQVGVFPVYHPDRGYDTPVVNPDTNTVTGFDSVWCAGRTYAADLGGMAFTLQALEKSSCSPHRVSFDPTVAIGRLEDSFMFYMLGGPQSGYKALEPLADGATRVLAYHMPKSDELSHDPDELAKLYPIVIAQHSKIPPTGMPLSTYNRLLQDARKNREAETQAKVRRACNTKFASDEHKLKRRYCH